jgi:hypothetical protein
MKLKLVQLMVSLTSNFYQKLIDKKNIYVPIYPSIKQSRIQDITCFVCVLYIPQLN